MFITLLEARLACLALVASMALLSVAHNPELILVVVSHRIRTCSGNRRRIIEGQRRRRRLSSCRLGCLVRRI